ncbi:ABC transporter permease [Schnuerera sp. xch1]|uniref:ABC transporter permease n=1 Tax=Schnuerera sp. xch1 TaxID=2874283 RepID=UPI003988E489
MKWTSYPYLLWIIIFILVPLVLVLLYAITATEEHISNLEFTLDNFNRFLDPKYFDVLWVSVKLALQSTVMTLILGYPIAILIAKEKPSKRNILISLFIIPMWMNFLLRTYAWLTLLGKNGIINFIISQLGFGPLDLLYNDGAVLLGMVYNFLPFMILPIYSVLVKIDNSLMESAEDLGANKFQVFTKITLPLSIPGIITGITMVFMPAVSTFVISRLLGGGQYMLIGNLVEQQFLWVGDWHFGSAISIIMMIFILLTMAITAKFDTQKKGSRGLW